LPIQNTKYKEANNGHWLSRQKKKIKSKEDDVYIELSINKYVKDELDRYLIFKEATKDREQWKTLLFKYINQNKQTPPYNTKYKEANIGSWLNNQKHKLKSKEDDVYIELSINKYVKDELDRYLIFKEATKDREQWKTLLFEYININKQIPSANTKYKEAMSGSWFSNQKKKIKSKEDNIYIELSINKYVKDELDRYFEYKNNK
jgi:phage tail tube protein FII